jgi:DNA polymerase III alpha subunit
MNKGKEHYNKYLYSHGLGVFSDEKSLMYCFDYRVFKTSKGTKMANMYCWDGSSMSKIVIFPNLYNAFASMLSNGQWYAAKLEAITDRRTRIAKLDGYKLSTPNSMIKIEDYIERKNINVSN